MADRGDNQCTTKRNNYHKKQDWENLTSTVLHSEAGQLNTPPEIINEMNLYFTKDSDRLIKERRPFNNRNAVKIIEFVNSRKPENVHFNVPHIEIARR